MKRKIIFSLFLVIGALIIWEISNWGRVEPSSPPQDLHPNNFFDYRYFSGKSVKIEELTTSEKIYGAVVPHHLLAYELIDRIFVQLKSQNPPLIILLGPNHFNRGERILTSSWNWQTPLGIVETDEKSIDQLVDTKLVKIDNNPFSQEHSIGNLMPFIKFYLPKAKVVPIIFHADVSWEESQMLAKNLSKLVTEKNAVIISSVDFSHYLTSSEAEQKDQETLKVLRNRNLPLLFTMDNDHLDSPASLGTLISTMNNLGINDFTLLDHTNSGIMLANDVVETTSYMTIMYLEP